MSTSSSRRRVAGTSVAGPCWTRWESGPPPHVVKTSVLQKVASELHPKVRNHGEGPSRGLLRDYEPSDGTF